LVSRQRRTIELGGTTVNLKFLGLTHSTRTWCSVLPKEKIIFVSTPFPFVSFPGLVFIDILSARDRGLHQQVFAGIGIG